MQNDHIDFELIQPTIKENYINSNEIDFQFMDFNKILGYSIKERCESIILDIINITRDISVDHSDDDVEYYWVCSSPEISSMFEIMPGFNQTGFEHEYDLNYTGSINFLGNIWHFLKNNSLDKPYFYVGYGKKCVKIEFKNFIF